jgi:glycosyltransferase involved in cell wall biosynthesis
MNNGGPTLKVLILNSARKFIGEAAHCLALARELGARGHDATLVLRRGFEPERRAVAEGLEVVPLAMGGKTDFRSDLGDLRALRRIIRERRPDVIHCHRGKDHWLAAALLTFGRIDLPLVRTRHVVVPVRPHAFNKWLFLRRTQRVMAVSDQAAASLGELRPQLGHRLSVIYSAVDQGRFDPSKRSEAFRAECGARPGQPLVGLIGRIQRIKGQRQFLDAAGMLTRQFPEARFLVAGTGCDGKFYLLTEHAVSADVADKVIFRGWLDDVATAIASLDVGVVASLGSEGSSRVTYEYMASGVPVVATRVGGIPEVISDGETGLLVDPGSPEQLAAAIGRVLRDREFARRLRDAALARVRGFHNYDRWIGQILGVYEQAIADRSAR